MEILKKEKEDKEEKSSIFENEIDFMMFYHTALRNVGLFTTISLATLTYSRFYRKKSNFYSIGLVLISIVFLLMAMLLNIYLFNISNNYTIDKKSNNVNNLLIFNKIIFILHISLIFYATFTFYRLYTNKQL